MSFAAVRFFFRRRFSLRQTEWTTNGSTYCKMCRKTISSNQETTKDDLAKTPRQMSNLYVNSTGDNSFSSTFSFTDGGAISSNFYRHFNLLKTTSNQEGTLKDSIVLAESHIPTFQSRQPNRHFDSTLTV